jgi:hypothetical protein
MARYQRGWLRVVERKQGRMWQLRYNAVDPVNGKKKERARLGGCVLDSQRKGRAGSPNESTKCRDASLECVLSLASPCVRAMPARKMDAACGACASATTALNSFTTMFGERSSDSWVPVLND